MRSAGSRLTETVVAGGPTGGATALPTLTLSASGLPVLSTGAVVVAGTVQVWPGWSVPEKSVAPPFSLTWSHTAAVAVDRGRVALGEPRSVGGRRKRLPVGFLDALEMAARDAGLRGDIVEAEAFLLTRGAQALPDGGDVRFDQFFVHRLASRLDPHSCLKAARRV